MKFIDKIEAWLWAIGEEWGAKPAREKSIIALIGVLMASLAVMQFALDASE
ncbi:MAG: hypothetical protein ACREC9_05100 [Methylocella sp.]